MPIKQLSDANSDGTTLGQSATDKVALHGATPTVQSATIADITDAASGAQIATAVNAIIAALEAKGIIASS